MPPKNSSGKEKDLGEEDEVLQAVILADSFNKRFKPLTSGKPRVCVLPLLRFSYSQSQCIVACGIGITEMSFGFVTVVSFVCMQCHAVRLDF